jgi:hypothetical protein
MAKQRFRLQFKFWLDMNKADEHALAEQIENLKQGGAFTKAIRDGIHLIVDLWQGNLDVLLTLFPWVEEAFYQRFTEHQSETSIQTQLARLEKLLIEQGSMPISSNPYQPKKLIAPQIAAPMQDDADELLRIKKAKSDSTSAQNFLDAAFGLVQ